MIKPNLVIADPYNIEHRKMYFSFEQDNLDFPAVSTMFETINSNYKKSYYEKEKNLSNDINENLFIEEYGIIKDACILTGQKDTKMCTIKFPLLNSKVRKRPLLEASIDHAFYDLTMNSVVILVNEEDKALVSQLSNNNFESLGKDGDNLMFLTEFIPTKKHEGIRQWK